jgi:hypothetical protein
MRRRAVTVSGVALAIAFASTAAAQADATGGHLRFDRVLLLEDSGYTSTNVS